MNYGLKTLWCSTVVLCSKHNAVSKRLRGRSSVLKDATWGRLRLLCFCFHLSFLTSAFIMNTLSREGREHLNNLKKSHILALDTLYTLTLKIQLQSSVVLYQRKQPFYAYDLQTLSVKRNISGLMTLLANHLLMG